MKTTFLHAGSIKEPMPLSKLLNHLGHQPAKINGEEQLYLNVLRNAETKPTLVVNTQLDVWFDRMTKKSGNVIDFGMVYWPGLDSNQVSEKINQLLILYSQPAATTISNGRKRKAIKLPFYQIEETKPIGCNTEITAYLQSQNLWEVSIGHLKEVYYYFVDENRRRKDFFAAGWQNENGGWEVRSKNFSGCLGRKGMTFIPGDEKSLILFEDYITYLGWKYAHKLPGPSILILNSPQFLNAAKKRALKFRDVAIFFDEQSMAEDPLSFLKNINKQKNIA